MIKNLTEKTELICKTPKFEGFTMGKSYYINKFFNYNANVFIENDYGKNASFKVDNLEKYFTVFYNEAGKSMEDKVNDPVNHPSHYTWLKEKCGIEVIDITRHMNFNLGNAIKYILRAGRKPIRGEDKSDFHAGYIQDLKKAAWYIDDEIKTLEGKQ